MIVIDASAVIEALVGNPTDALLQALTGEVHAPDHLDVEVHSALRGLALGRKISIVDAGQASADFYDLTIARHRFEALALGVWDLRHRAGTYDAAYLVLADALGAPLVTCDAKLVGIHPEIEVRVVRREP